MEERYAKTKEREATLSLSFALRLLSNPERVQNMTRLSHRMWSRVFALQEKGGCDARPV